MYRSLQQSYSISSQDVLMAMDDCEESLHEIDLTSFLNTLCGHMKTFRERGDAGHSPGDYPPTPTVRGSTTFIGEGEEGRPEETPEETPEGRPEKTPEGRPEETSEESCEGRPERRTEETPEGRPEWGGPAVASPSR